MRRTGTRIMNRLVRLAFYLGIGMAVTLFALLLVVVIPQVASINHWNAVSDDEMLERITAHPAYEAMYERYPDAVETVTFYERSVNVLVGVANYESGTQLILDLHAYPRSTTAFAECSDSDVGPTDRMTEPFTVGYIRTTDCVESEE